MKLEYIERSRLTVSPTNMRAKRKAADVDDLVPSIRARGVLVPLLVRPGSEADAYEIVAGRRRFGAASIVAGETNEDPLLPCAIIEAGDDAAALEASLIENLARLDPDEVTQWETFARLVREGKSVDDVAATFGITPRLVTRILALGNLLPRLRTLYRQDLIDAVTIRHLTMATKAQQKDWLTLYDSPDAYAPTGQNLKTWLCGGELIATKAALFDPALYAGPIVSDLFGEDSYFADPELFWKLQREAVETRREAYLEEGWAGVEVIEAEHGFRHWEYEKRSRSRGGKVFMLLSRRGEIEIIEGLVLRREAAKSDGPDSFPKAERPEVTATLRNYLDLHRHAAVRSKLLKHPSVAVRLLVAHAIASEGHWNVEADPQRSDNPETKKSVETSSGEAVFGARRRDALALLGLDQEAPSLVRSSRPNEVMTLFLRLLELKDEDFSAVAAVVMGETLEVGATIVEDLGIHLSVDMADRWRADDAFFSLVRDKHLLTAIVAEVAGSQAAAANAGQTGKVMKGIIRDALAGQNGRQHVEGWVPRWLRFPAGSYRAPALTAGHAGVADDNAAAIAQGDAGVPAKAAQAPADAENADSDAPYLAEEGGTDAIAAE